MPYSVLKPSSLRFEDETTGNARIIRQKDDELRYEGSGGDLIQILSNTKIDLKANQPSAGLKGRLYFCTDTKEFFIDDGANWQTIGLGSKRSALFIQRDGIQTLPANNETVIQFNSLVYDENDEWDSTNYRFTVSSDGMYAICCGIGFNSSSWSQGDGARLGIRKNGGGFLYTDFKRAWNAISTYFAINGSICVKLNAGDYIDIVVYIETSGDKDTNSYKEYNFLNIVRIY